ncbi:hypothetical protein PR048_007670 [Dryococelus australis]|uniref:Uncharacterized protein n=1 Tax=Dryococelus australis TaxID=614101 RepID=A0ABQ9HUW6_9NEOP|nr:hypothetical protein PR048_007670 [Dryococelus australis]
MAIYDTPLLFQLPQLPKIFPYNRKIFQDADIAPSFVRDRPDPDLAPSCSHDKPAESPGTPTQLRPDSSLMLGKFSRKVTPRKRIGGRKTRKSAILAGTPEKTALEEEYEKRGKQGLIKGKKEMSKNEQACQSHAQKFL